MFFKALEERDPARLDAALHPDLSYSGPLFGKLDGWRVQAMWQHVLRWPQLAVSVSEVKVTPMQGSVTWQMSFAAGNKRVVLHDVTTHVTFREDRIHAQVDDFSLYRHAGMSLGARGWALGWLPPVQSALREDALRALGGFIDEHHLSDGNRIAPPPPAKRKSRLPPVNVNWEPKQR